MKIIYTKSQPVKFIQTGVLFSLLTLSSARSILRRSSLDGWTNPCFALETGGSDTKRSPQDTFKALSLKTEKVKRDFSITKKYIGDMYLKGNTSNLLRIDQQSFFDFTTLELNPSNVTQALLSHYEFLYTFVKHLTYMCQDGRLLTTNAAAACQNIKLADKYVYKIICEIKIGLLSAGADTSHSVDKNEYFQKFLDMDGNFTAEVARAYVIAKDGETLMDRLNSVYTGLGANS